MREYDLVIIGSGWAGFNAALTAKSSGLKVALVEKGQVGGTCLNHGCIPTKALIQSAKIYSLAKKAALFGVDLSSPHPDFVKIQGRKDAVIRQLRSGMQFMLKGIDYLAGQAKLVSPTEVELSGERLKAGSILVAGGSRPAELEALKFDAEKIISSDEILNLQSIPQSLLIIGGGVIGCEFAGLFAGLGARVCITEKLEQLLPGEDKEVARKLEVIFKKKNISVNTGREVTPEDLKDYERVLVCVGRVPVTQGLGLEEAGVKLERGRVVVDEYLRTNVPNIYAAGDCTGKIMLAHFAAYQGRIAAENIAGKGSLKSADSRSVPGCIFTDPEIAGVGLTEEKAVSAGISVKVHKFDFQGSGMARIMDESEGFVKIVSAEKSGEIMGAAIIGPRATELIASLAIAVTNRLTVEQIRGTIFAHPSLSESIWDALNR